MIGFIFALRKHDYDIHSTVFNLFKALKIKDFTPNHPETKPIIFHVNGDHIICRTNAQVAGIPVKEEHFDVTSGDFIEGTVTLPRDVPKLTMTKDQFDDFLKKNGRKPKYTESHKYTRLTDEQLPEYALNILVKAGLEIQEIKFSDGAYHLISGRGKSLKAVDVHFKAQIKDFPLFEQAWFNGIGRNKTYGFGMLRAIKL